ncbi:MAG: GNAT family N-acetyltransferase [Chloroflexi bacterium]|nr:GNAT family N-acetyltransferase [Chloroflexota bacterium]
MRIEEITTFQALEALRPEWSRLWEQCPNATPFQSPEWLLPWWCHLGGGELLVLALRDEGTLVGLAPLFIHEWQGRRQVSPIGVSYSDYHDVLLMPDVARAGAELILQRLAELRSRWDVCVLPELRDGPPLLSAAIPNELRAQVTPLEPCPVLALPATAGEFVAQLSAHHRRNLRRACRLLEKGGRAQIERANEATRAEFVNALFRLHGVRWQEQNEPGVLSNPNVQRFHCDVTADFLRRGILRLYALRRNGAIDAVLYGFASGGRFYAYLGGFDPQLEQASPGTLLTFHAIQEAIREGCREYDFLRGAENYKYMWGARDRRNWRVTLWHAAPPEE